MMIPPLFRSCSMDDAQKAGNSPAALRQECAAMFTAR
jgi:hypothetical protein